MTGPFPVSLVCSQLATAHIVWVELARKNVHHYEGGEVNIVKLIHFTRRVSLYFAESTISYLV